MSSIPTQTQEDPINPLPPPDESTGGNDGFVSFALLVFVIIAPIFYFGPVLRVDRSLSDGLLPVNRGLDPADQKLACRLSADRPVTENDSCRHCISGKMP